MAAEPRTGTPLLAVDNLVVQFPVRGDRRAKVHAVDEVSFEIMPQETFGLIGESGSGKSTVARAVAQLVKPVSGSITLGGQRLDQLSRRQLRQTRRRFQMIFQDPNEALDPRMSVRASIAEPLRVQGLISRGDERSRVDELLDRVGLAPEHGDRHPHELSGGQRQRVNIARALTLEPELIICDEVVSALDVSIQADILNLFAKLQRELDLSYLFITHDLSVVAHISDRVGVMYLGRLMEVAPTDELVAQPLHPYTEALLSAEPQPLPSTHRTTSRILLEGDIPSPIDPPPGCVFNTRCPYATELCRTEVPDLRPAAGSRLVACHHADELSLRATNGQSAPTAPPAS
ncbi:MAG: ABC transporter ATP-binding protein [Actinomycetota bacterium]